METTLRSSSGGYRDAMTAPHFAEHVLHVDMDAFFVEVERLHDPTLRGVPVIVGGLGARGVVAAASYEARPYGVGSAMPMARARALCPNARLIPPAHQRYRAVSEDVFAVFRSVTPLVEGLSVDEAFLDIAGLRRHFATPSDVGAHLRRRLQSELGLPASVGIASTKLLAKLASEEAKPDGLRLVPAGAERRFLHPLPVRRLWGVGEATHAALETLGVETIGELAAVPQATLEQRLGVTAGRHLAELSAGIDLRPVTPDAAAKSVSAEETFAADLTSRVVIEAELLRQCERVGWRLRRAGLAGRTVTLKVRYADFTTVTRSHSSTSAVDLTHDLAQTVRELAGRLDLDRPVRLLGVAVTTLEAAGSPRQLALDRSKAWEDVTAAVDRVRTRYGMDAVSRARLVDVPEDPSRKPR